MVKFCLILLLNFLASKLEAQSGKYSIDTINGKGAEGSITINPYTITIEQDSFKVVLPVVNIIEEKRKTFYILEGCLNNVSYQGSATLYDFEMRYSNGLRHGLSLYVELRTKQGYSFTRFGLFYMDSNDN